MSKNSIKRGFTLVELIFVIVILGIISTIATDIYLNIYRNYIYSKIINELESQTDALLEQISSRLSDRIKSATIARTNAGVPISVYNAGLGPQHTILEWISESTESRYLNGNANFNNSVGWSGYANINATNNATLVSPGSHFNLINNSLVGGNLNNLAVIFEDGNIDDGQGYGFAGMGGGNNNVMRINLGANAETANIAGYNIGSFITERYSLAHSAYTIQAGLITNGRFDLFLFHNYRPWNGETFQNNGTRTILAKNVTLFRFRSLEQNIELKICMQGQNLNNAGVAGGFGDGLIVCKTKVVY